MMRVVAKTTFLTNILFSPSLILKAGHEYEGLDGCLVVDFTAANYVLDCEE